MLFNSFEFLVFLPVVFAAYWFVLGGRTRAQNALLLVASYVFYGWWDWRFLALIAGSSAVDYVVGIRLAATTTLPRRRQLLAASLVANLGSLACFKYYDFFAMSLQEALAAVGWTIDPLTLNVLLPVGISFYTFQTLSYTLDIYRGRLQPTRDPVVFFAFVSFFPQLVAGPIERASSLLPQFQRSRAFDRSLASDGLRQALWGMFKKVVVADSCAAGVSLAFDDIEGASSGRLALGLVYFSFQIYGDFSGYSDIAIGTAKLFGFRLTQNFATPYFSRSIGEFWRRWHISLSSWFRDYVYIPLGGGRGTLARRCANLLITFTVSGLWHGANWTFVVWGVLNGLFYLPSVVSEHVRGVSERPRAEARFVDLPRIIVTYSATLLAWTFFRAATLGEAMRYLERLATAGGGPELRYEDYLRTTWILMLVVIDWRTRGAPHSLQLSRLPVIIRWGVYYALVVLTGIYFGRDVPFIYFQF